MDNNVQSPEEILEKIRERVRARKKEETPANGGPARTEWQPAVVETAAAHDLSSLRREVADANLTHSLVGAINPRPPGLHNELIQFAKKVMRRMLTWYTRPLHQFHGSVARALNETTRALESLQAALPASEQRIKSDLRREWQVELQNVDAPHGRKAAAGLWFNDPLWIGYEQNGRAYWSATSERVIERSWLFRQVSRYQAGAKIIDLGCAESLISFELASSGYVVTGVDIRDYPLQHPNLQFVKADICGTNLESSKYDVAIALSTIEHVGIGYYGDQKRDQGEREAMQEIMRLLKPGGHLFLSVPFGHGAITRLHRIYDSGSLRGLVKDFVIEKLEFGIKVDQKIWLSPTSEDAAAAKKHDSDGFPGAVALAVCRKSQGSP